MPGMVFWTFCPPGDCTWKRQATATGPAEIGSADHFLVGWPCSDLSLILGLTKDYSLCRLSGPYRDPRDHPSPLLLAGSLSLPVDPGII